MVDTAVLAAHALAFLVDQARGHHAGYVQRLHSRPSRRRRKFPRFGAAATVPRLANHPSCSTCAPAHAKPQAVMGPAVATATGVR